MFQGVFPELETLNVMKLDNPHSAILSAVIFNALIIVALIPLALRGREVPALGAAAVLRRNLLIYGLGGVIVAVHRHQAHRSHHLGSGSEVMRRQLVTGLLVTVVLTLLLGIALPARRLRGRPRSLQGQRRRLVRRERQRQGRRVFVDRPAVPRHDGEPNPKYFQPRPSAAGDGYDPLASGGVEPRAVEPEARDAVRNGSSAYRR